MNEFTELLVGTFANKRQAQSHPTRYAHIRVSHRLIGGNRIYGEQAYNYLLNRPYRQFVIDVVQEKEEYRLKNYEIINNNIRTDFDHRIAMSFCVMGSKIGPLNILEADSINTSFPTFKKEFNEVGGKIY